MKKRKDGRWIKTKMIKGRRIAFYSTAKTERAAERDIENQMLEYQQKAEQGKTFKEVAELWQEEHDEKVKASTVKRYNSCVERAIDEFGNSLIKDITPQELNSFILRFAKRYQTLKTVKMQRSVIRMIFSYAMLNGYVDIDVSMYVPLPKNLTQKKREIPADSIIKKVENSVECTFGLFAYLILKSGLRRGEALALTYGDIDRDNKRIKVDKSCIHIGSAPEIVKPKTEAGVRYTFLLDCLAEKIPYGKADEYIFADESGKLPYKAKYERLWKKYLQEAGIESLTAHQLRHYFATFILEQGIDEKTVQTVMGHSDILLTRNTYQHLTNSAFKNAVEALNKSGQNVVKYHESTEK